MKEAVKGRSSEVQARVRVRSRQQRVSHTYNLFTLSLERGLLHNPVCEQCSLIMSLQLFERRAKVLKKKSVELNLWRHITPDMMSEEEEDGDGFVRHSFSWRSQVLNNFLIKLDKRLNTGNPKILAKKRVYGDVIEKPAPANVPLWMKANVPSSNSKDDSTDIEGELTTGNSSSDEDLL